MSTSTVDRTGDWDTVSFAGGYAGLSDLADDEFSGMVTAGPARLFMLRGSVIGILDGDIEDFADASGTAREAPHPALPLLAVMQERSEEVRAEYYTEETPISEVDRTLSDGNFTGYVELSENVLSGDYYQVYHQGHSMSVAYVGASERLIEDDEAFEQADDEVGIYEVRPVDIEVVEIPEPASQETASAGTAGSGAAGAAAAGASAAEEVDEDASAETEDTAAESDDGAVETEDAADETDAATADAAEESEGGPETATSDEADADTAAPTAGADEAGDAESAAGNSADEAVESSDDADSASADDAPGDTGTTGADSTEAGGDAAGDEPASSGGADERAPVQESTADTASPADASTSGERSSAEATPTESETAGTRSGGEAGAGIPDAADVNRSAGGTRRGEPAPDHPAAGSGGGSRQRTADTGGDGAGGALEPGDLEMRSLPSLDPERTASASKQERERRSTAGSGAAAAGTGAAAGGTAGAAADQARESAAESGPTDTEGADGPAAADTDREPAADAEPDRSAPDSTAEEPANGPSADGTAADDGANDAAATDDDAADETAPEGASAAGGTTAAAVDLEDAEAEAERLESELESLQDEHEDVVAERDRLESELAEAREEIERLRDRLEEATGQAAEASTKLSPQEAVDETNLFIRYDSKGEATLEKAHAGEVDKAAVDDNLRLEYHTSFDADDASVDGIGFDKFLTETVQYRFVDWLVRTLLYEIRDTGNTGPMAELYDALPKVDRAELNGQVTVKYTEDGQEHRSQLGFDVIVRDRMGNPLIVANLNDSRDPATDSMMTDLVRAAERVGETSSSLAGGFLVTRSFFEPEALETAEEATAGGLLSRGKQKSFVNLSRKGGYHLCLVEARNDEFHLAVPEL